MRRLLIALVVVVAGCGDGYATPPEREVPWKVGTLRGGEAFVGYAHSGSIEDTHVTVHVDGSTAFVGIRARVPTDYLNTDLEWRCFRVPLHGRVTRLVRTDGSLPRWDWPRTLEERQSARRERRYLEQSLRDALAADDCDDIRIERSGDGV